MRIPLVTVLMPVYNGEKYLAEAIDSILRQTFVDFEFLIVDDGSTDDTAEILAGYARQDLRIRIVRNEKNLGIATSLNRGIELAQGDFIARMDADDVSLPTRLDEQILFLQLHPEIAAVFSKILLFPARGSDRYWDADQKNITNEQIRQTLPQTNCLAHPTLCVRTEVLKEIGYDIELVRSQDWALWLRWVSAGYKLAKIDRVLLHYRIHEKSETQQARLNNKATKKIYVCRDRFLQKQAMRGVWGAVERETLLNNILFLLGQFDFPEVLDLFASISPAVIQKMSEGQNSNEMVIAYQKLADGGAERVSAVWANEFTRRNYRVTVLTSEEPSSADYPLLSSVARITIPYGQKYLEKLASFCAKTAAGVFIVGDEYYSDLNYKKMLLLKAMGKKVIVVHHGAWHFPLHPSVRWKQVFEKRPKVYRLLDAVVCLSLVDKAYWNHVGVDNVVYIPNPVPFALPAQRSELKNPVVIWVGRFSHEKQPGIMIDAFRLVQQKVPESKLYMLGQGDLVDQCKKKVRDLGLEQSILFPGHVDVRPYLAKASIHVMTSRHEGFPLTWLEAKAYGVPTVMFAIGNLELERVPGYVSVPSNDAVSLAGEIEHLLTDELLRIRLGILAVESLSQFSQEKIFGKWTELFEYIAERTRKEETTLFDEQISCEELTPLLFDQMTRLGIESLDHIQRFQGKHWPAYIRTLIDDFFPLDSKRRRVVRRIYLFLAGRGAEE